MIDPLHKTPKNKEPNPNPRSKPKPQQVRVLKVQIIGDHYRKQVKLQIRLQGKWLLDAGLQADQHVQVSNPRAGVLVIQCLEK